MLKFAGYQVVMQEVPGEISLAFNISGCPRHCVGCHSEYLQGDIGTPLDANALDIIERYRDYVSCVCFMGGDHDIEGLKRVVAKIRAAYPGLKICLYSGADEPDEELFSLVDYLKYGHYDAKCGGLKEPTTNQRMLKLTEGREDITAAFWKKPLGGDS